MTRSENIALFSRSLCSLHSASLCFARSALLSGGASLHQSCKVCDAFAGNLPKVYRLNFSAITKIFHNFNFNELFKTE